MKILIIGKKERYASYMPDLPITKTAETVYVSLGTSVEEMLEAAGDAEVIFADAIAKVPAEMIEKMPNLKMIHSEGVAYNGIDVNAAKARGIAVCNNPGANAGAVAEQAILLMLGLTRDVINGHNAELAGRQIQTKEAKMLEGIVELADCKVGLVGFGNIAKATALRLNAFGCEVYYYNRHRKSEEEEQKYNVKYLPLDELAAACDIVSLHLAVTPETTGMVNAEFLSKMKKTAYIVNTARGDLVNNEDLKAALEQGVIAGAGFDTIAPEPTTLDNPLLNLSKDCNARVIYSPHVGGITLGTFRRCHRNLWENAARIERGEAPVRTV